VTWEWTGQGGEHTVVDEEGHTFEAAGASRYVCTPHRTKATLGAVIVE